MLTVSSRTTEVTYPGRKTPARVLVPILDLMNYSGEETVPGLVDHALVEQGMVEFMITKDVEAGEQVRHATLSGKGILDSRVMGIALHIQPLVHLQ